ncbi:MULTISPECIES: hypothetical protein [Nocardia]|uniref:hypothetical protein n=1 Tax=Nocardia TaxID=1817 RepID=UPI000D68F799|nr:MULTISPECIES: hypothetical protein [Nocardia]
MTDHLSDERLHALRDDKAICTNAGERSMAAELIEARAYIAELEAEFAELPAIARRMNEHINELAAQKLQIAGEYLGVLDHLVGCGYLPQVVIDDAIAAVREEADRG